MKEHKWCPCWGNFLWHSAIHARNKSEIKPGTVNSTGVAEHQKHWRVQVYQGDGGEDQYQFCMGESICLFACSNSRAHWFQICKPSWVYLGSTQRDDQKEKFFGHSSHWHASGYAQKTQRTWGTYLSQHTSVFHIHFSLFLVSLLFQNQIKTLLVFNISYSFFWHTLLKYSLAYLHLLQIISFLLLFFSFNDKHSQISVTRFCSLKLKILKLHLFVVMKILVKSLG